MNQLAWLHLLLVSVTLPHGHLQGVQDEDRFLHGGCGPAAERAPDEAGRVGPMVAVWSLRADAELDAAGVRCTTDAQLLSAWAGAGSGIGKVRAQGGRVSFDGHDKRLAVGPGSLAD
ncbi:hypothetical protein [Streptomyces atratus]|uniref:hypothetical protein n=1 Tax=Streptomyces atratus TaxID=1893 RepID=UPI0013004FAB|nr:hypothetical protein [Streptomyces atratus]